VTGVQTCALPISLEEIVSSFDRVAKLVAEITGATREQAAVLAEINAAIGHMDEATQHNAALAEESSAAARAMQAESDKLVELVGIFRTSERAEETAIPAAVPAPPAEPAGRALPQPAERGAERVPERRRRPRASEPAPELDDATKTDDAPETENGANALTDIASGEARRRTAARPRQRRRDDDWSDF
jgi:hypothetical protein